MRVSAVDGRIVSRLSSRKTERENHKASPCRASTMDSDVRVFDVSMDTIPVDSSITIEAPKIEVIDLDSTSSCDVTATSCLDDENSIYSTKSTGRVSSPDEIETIKVMIRSRRESQSTTSNNVAPQPAFKVMFRDERVSRYSLVYTLERFVYNARAGIPALFNLYIKYFKCIGFKCKVLTNKRFFYISRKKNVQIKSYIYWYNKH